MQSNAIAAEPKQLEKQADSFQQGLLQVQKNELEQALTTWRKLYQSDALIPELKRALQNNIGVVLMKLGRFEEAKQHLDQALKEDAQVATTIENLNKLYAYDAQKAYKKIFKDTNVVSPDGQLLYFDIKRAEIPNDKVITDIRFADSVRMVEQATEAWRKAWSDQNIETYLGFYDDEDFIPQNGGSVSAWKNGRYSSVTGPKFIKVQTDDVRFSPISKEMVRVEFFQRYQSDRFQDDIKKVLLWKKRDTQWKIVQEVVIYGNS